MSVILEDRDPWCYSFDSSITPENLDDKLASNENVVYEGKILTGEERTKFLTIAALDTLLKELNPVTTRAFLDKYGHHEHLIWEIAVRLGTSEPKNVIEWLQ